MLFLSWDLANVTQVNADDLKKKKVWLTDIRKTEAKKTYIQK